MENCTLASLQDLKEKGNEAFKIEDWIEAISFYTQGIELSPSDDKELVVLLKNRAAAYLKQEKHEKALKDCTKALEIVPTDPKALFRRCQVCFF